MRFGCHYEVFFWFALKYMQVPNQLAEKSSICADNLLMECKAKTNWFRSGIEVSTIFIYTISREIQRVESASQSPISSCITASAATRSCYKHQARRRQGRESRLKPLSPGKCVSNYTRGQGFSSQKEQPSLRRSNLICYPWNCRMIRR